MSSAILIDFFLVPSTINDTFVIEMDGKTLLLNADTQPDSTVDNGHVAQ